MCKPTALRWIERAEARHFLTIAVSEAPAAQRPDGLTLWAEMRRRWTSAAQQFDDRGNTPEAAEAVDGIQDRLDPTGV